MSRAGRTAASVVLSVLGVLLLVWQVRQVGLDHISDSLSRVGWGFLRHPRVELRPVRAAIARVDHDHRRACLPSAARSPPRSAATRIGNLTPLSLIVSEPAKSIYLRG